ncbi:FkbH-like protein [Catenulispora sp. GAS73]|uniref:HAD-IIIC family phosphatase n=1 Tax=Catenulispora sp. GAS73 TaxID=3156269 RepID=UPI0035162A8A
MTTTAASPDPLAGATDAPAALLALHREGALAAAFPRLPALLRDLTDEQVLQAGRLLTRLDPRQVRAEHPATPTLRVALTGHGTLPALLPALSARLAGHGVLIEPYQAAFDGYVFELGDPDSRLYAAEPQLTVAVLDAAVIADELPLPWGPDDVAEVFERRLGVIEGLCERFAARNSGTLALTTMPLPRSLAAQLIDHRSRARLGAVWREANARLLRLSERHPAVLVLDLDTLVAEGVAVQDARLDAYAKAHLSDALLGRLARELGHLGAHLAGRTRKCLVLDLDGTLWGGVLGEDGPDGVEVGHGLRGEAFSSFQRLARQIGAQGVLLAVASKNDLDPVLDMLRGPRMTLREQDFVRVTANWSAKPRNLRDLAAELNIGLDALVFADDSPTECGLVRTVLPEVAVVELGSDPAEHAGRLLREGWFDVRELTAEDHARPARYREEVSRQDFRASFDGLDDYLDQLQLHVRVARPTAAELPRISQITLRTNQFNLTGARLDPAEVARRAQDPDHLVLGVHVGDRFGDSGLVGAVFARREGDTLRLENFLLSCRVFARGVEQAVLAWLLHTAPGLGARQVLAQYRPTAKNSAFSGFYPANGFSVLAEDEAEAETKAETKTGTKTETKTFRHDLADPPPIPAHLRLTDEVSGPVPVAGT